MTKPASLLIGALVLSAAVSMSVVTAFAQQGRNNGLSGMVYNSGGQPVPDIYVELLNEFGSTIARTRTNGSGLYSFRGIAEGKYQIRVKGFGTNYLEQTKAVSLISISAIPGSGGINRQIDFSLVLNRAFAGPLSAPGVIFIQEVPLDAKKLYEKGVDLLGRKKYEEGLDKLKTSLEIFPQYFAALDRLGQEYIQRGYNRPAYVLLTKALEINSKSYSSTFGLGVAQFRLGEITKSIETLKQAVRFYNRSSVSQMWLGIALHENGNLVQAEKALNQANRLSRKKSASVHWQLARLFKTQKRFNDSARELELYLKYNKNVPNVDKIRRTIANLRMKAGQK